MGTREHLRSVDVRAEAKALESWSACGRQDETVAWAAALAPGAVTALLVALAAFFIAFAPGT